MSAINLTLLGLLFPKPINAYELAKYVEKYELQEILKLSIPAIYKNLKKLEEEGFLAATSSKQGEMPEKTIYSLTANGRQLFYSLMDKYADEEIRYRFDFNPVVVNLDKLPPKKGLKIVARLKTRIEKQKNDIQKEEQILSGAGKTGKVLLSQIRHVNKALLDWVDELLSDLNK